MKSATNGRISKPIQNKQGKREKKKRCNVLNFHQNPNETHLQKYVVIISISGMKGTGIKKRMDVNEDWKF